MLVKLEATYLKNVYFHINIIYIYRIKYTKTHCSNINMFIHKLTEPQKY